MKYLNNMLSQNPDNAVIPRHVKTDNKQLEKK